MTAIARADTGTGLRRNAIGLREVLFQSITDMAPGAAIAASIPAGVAFAGGSLPLAVVFALVAAAFASYENVSRRHATITVSDTGQATIRDEYSTNGTFVNDDRVLPGTDVRITDGDRVRLAADVAAEVSLPRQGFSSNGHPRAG